MSNFDKACLIVIGMAFFAIVLAWRMVAADIAPKWLKKILAPPARR
jgi:hypothetical protein